MHLDALDGLRGIAVLLVVLSHLGNGGYELLPALDLRGTGRHGVYLFFALSAFLLTRPFVAREAPALRDGRVWLRYALRRILRIYPLYGFVLACDFAATRLGPPPALAFTAMPLDSLIGHLALRQGRGLYWTIPVEFAYYLVLPLVVVGFAAALRRRLGAAAVACAALIFASIRLWPPAEVPRDALSLGPYLPIFLLGSLAALASTHIDERAAPDALLRRMLRWAAIASALAALLLTPSLASLLAGSPIEKDHFHRSFTLFGAVWSTLILGVVHGGGPLARALSSRALRFVGVVSFSVYLWHMQVIKTLVLQAAPVSTYAVAWAALLLSLLLAALSWTLIEAPFLRGALARRVLALTRSQPRA